MRMQSSMQGIWLFMFAHFHRHSYTGCKTAVSEIIASQAALVADVNDIAKAEHVREKICDIIGTAELVFWWRGRRLHTGQWSFPMVPGCRMKS